MQNNVPLSTDSHTDSVLVLGATGKTGRRVVRELRATGVPVRAASRSGDVRFDWTDPATWPGALEGASAVYLVAPDEGYAAVPEFTARAVRAGVGRFVVLSGRGIEHVGPDFGQGMVTAEEAVRGSGAEWAVLRANNFNQNFDEDLWWRPLRDGRLALPIGDVEEPFVDADDVAAVAAVLLTRTGHTDGVHEVSGPRGLTFGDAVATMARAAGREIRYVELTPEEYHAELLADGYPEAVARALGTMFALHREGHTAAPADGVRRVLGREPVDFTAYAERAAAAGAWS
ncbi:NAD(P)H-binding protein [Streptomyces sp. UNOC14_S4]|uniref:NmrA family NAD(P)-binding protein n=1 Tax=Streptomyces sp. UNOC14_S4 TaxID=2872340 RepID=UPI001E540A47|nr:NAD(P)H-binding protein [Streptomyces sp. UNOC14_S4]MCC3771742.1 NAD(P)H-binding protein [Streptomyces sp. UNOC14_S4]